VDVYGDALSWTPFLNSGHARAAGRAMAKLHAASASYDATARMTQQLVSSFTIFAGGCGVTPMERMESYLESRPMLRAYVEERAWRRDFDALLMPLYRKLEPWLGYLDPLWTHNDFHASNLIWSGDGTDAEVMGIIDFGLSDRTNAVHDLATAMERNGVEWLRAFSANEQVDVVHLDHLCSLLDGYGEISPLSYEMGQALVAMLPLVHCEFALSETDYFLSVLGSPEKAALAYEGYFLRHAEWFARDPGRRLLGELEVWIEGQAAASQGKQATEKAEHWREIDGQHTSGPKGPVDSIAVSPGMNPRPTSEPGFSGGPGISGAPGFSGEAGISGAPGFPGEPGISGAPGFSAAGKAGVRS
jgi:Ser/Thr protein kinase RdoA (MazF antagonist)